MQLSVGVERRLTSARCGRARVWLSEGLVRKFIRVETAELFRFMRDLEPGGLDTEISVVDASICCCVCLKGTVSLSPKRVIL